MLKITMGIAIFGGSFDPIHNGHINFAKEALKLDSISEIYFIPTFVSPFKDGVEVTKAEDRLEMASLGTEQYEHFKVLDIEIRRGGKSYTIDTVNEVIDFFPEEEISLMIGEDSFKDIEKWYKSDELLKIVDLIVMVRPGEEFLESMDSSKGFCYDENSNVITSSYGRDITLIRENLTNASSTTIRDKIKLGESVAKLVPSEVLDFIKSKNTYLRSR